ncbi:hypothetical protein VPB88_19155 [Klebsiella pneumoniae]|uniref:hypothetical protein n=1 Tax=Klebsiella pneumoniae TaxID=573 RepID=UPI002D77ADEC|nr:hypothetical protein [Klebsiella pneumoniae]WRU55819.1 hypothetical protein VPB88_19155 [Klebsiella pneumoniae]
MGFYVQIQKTSSQDGKSKYVFYNERGRGEFSINESTGKIDYYQKMPNDTSYIAFSRAAIKVLKYWEANGKLPDQEVWAS